MKKTLSITLSLTMALVLILSIAVLAIAADLPVGAKHQVVTVTNGMNPGTYLVNDTWSSSSSNGYASNRLINSTYFWDPATMNDYVFDPTLYPNMQWHPDGFPLRATYRTVVEHQGEMRYLAQTYPDITKIHFLGYTNGISTNSATLGAFPEYRIPLYALEVCNKPGVMDGRPATLHQAGNHAGELDSNEFCANLMWYLCTNYGKIDEVTELLDTTRVYLMPTTNSDGNMVSFRTASGNRRCNARGVDLNRNWAYRWGSSTGSTASPGTSGNYRGFMPNSEPETRAISQLYREDNIVSSVSGHTNGQIVIFAWAHIENPKNAHPLIYELAKRQTDINGYTAQNGNVMYSQSGEINDYLWGSMRALGFTYEYMQPGQTNPYLGTTTGQNHIVFNIESPQGDPEWAFQSGTYVNRPTADLTAPLAFLDPEEFHAGYQNLVAGAGTNVLAAPGRRMLTNAMVTAELAKRPGFVNGKIFMSHVASSATEGQNIVRTLSDAGAKGWIVVNTANSLRDGNYGHYSPASGTYSVSGINFPVTAVTKGYAQNMHKTSLADPTVTVTFKSTNADVTSVDASWLRNRPAYMANMQIAREFANQLKGTIKSKDGQLLDATLNASLEIEGKIMRWNSTPTNDTALASLSDPNVSANDTQDPTQAYKKQWNEWHTPKMDVVGGNYTWYILPSKQTEYPDKGWDIVASSPGYYSSPVSNVRFPIGDPVVDANGVTVMDPLYQQVIENFDFVLQNAIAVHFDFDKIWSNSSDIIIPFTTFAPDGQKATLPVIVTIAGQPVEAVSIGKGEYIIVFNPNNDLGIGDNDDVELFIDLDGDNPAHTAYTNTIMFGGPKLRIAVTSVEVGNGQANVNFNIASANGKGYELFLYKLGDDGGFVLYNDVNYNSKGAHIKGLTNGATYFAYTEYLGFTRSDIVMLTPKK
jgi:hypothetical protein